MSYYRLKNDKKSGFYIDHKIKIYTKSKRFLFSTIGHFNLPEGIFYVTGKPRKTDFRIYRKLNYLQDRDYNNKFKLKIVKDLGKKAFTYHSIGIIKIDKEYYHSLNKNGKMFVICHEVAHSKCSDEIDTDNLAANILLDMGYNPIQIIDGIKNAMQNGSKYGKFRAKELKRKLQTI